MLPILSPLLRQRKSIATGFPGPYVAIRFSVSLPGDEQTRTNACNRSAVCAAARTTVVVERPRQGFSRASELVQVWRKEACRVRKPMS